MLTYVYNIHYTKIYEHIEGGHKGPIHDIAVHPSGKLALSVSKDNTMKLWNLVHGMV
jgi:WD40 repeat protein